MNTQTDVRSLIVCKDVALTTTGTINQYTDLTDGGLAIVDIFGAAYATGGTQTVDTKLRFVVRNGTSLKYSDWFKSSQVNNGGYCGFTDYTAETQQITYLGYNGTTGSFDTNTDIPYTVKIKFNETDCLGASTSMETKETTYVNTAATGTQYANALGIADPLAATMAAQPRKDIRIERINSGTLGTLGTGSGTWTYTEGSQYVTAGDIDDAGGGVAALVVGDTLVFGTTQTSAAYKVIEIDTTNDAAKLDTKFRGTTGSGAYTTLRVIRVADENAWGVKFTGIAGTPSQGKTTPRVVRFNVYASTEFTTATVTYNTDAVLGQGTYELMLQEEWFCNKNDGNKATRDFMTNTVTNVVNTTYKQLDIKWANDKYTTLSQTEQMKQIKVIFPSAEAALSEGTITAVLDDTITTIVT